MIVSLHKQIRLLDGTIDRFWNNWKFIYNIILKSEKQYFTSVLLFDTEINWSEEREDFIVFEGRAEEYSGMLHSIGIKTIKSAIKVLSTSGSKAFLPEGLTWITQLLKNNPEQIKDINTVSCERLIKRLYYNHIISIKKSESFINDFIWLLDYMIELGNSTAFLFRENVISYKIQCHFNLVFQHLPTILSTKPVIRLILFLLAGVS